MTSMNIIFNYIRVLATVLISWVSDHILFSVICEKIENSTILGETAENVEGCKTNFNTHTYNSRKSLPKWDTNFDMARHAALDQHRHRR